MFRIRVDYKQKQSTLVITNFFITKVTQNKSNFYGLNKNGPQKSSL